MPAAVPIPLIVAVALLLGGCRACHDRRHPPTPSGAGIDPRAVDDPTVENAVQADIRQLYAVGEKVREQVRPARPMPKRSVLCLSGGGSYGAYSAGVLCGWTARGDRPQFDVVTGISTGSLIAPFAFLGPDSDGEIRTLFTTVRSKDIYRTRYVRGLVSDSFADNEPLARRLRQEVNCELVNRIAAEHARGRRLYIGTTELEGKRFVVWDVGAIACRGRPDDADLIVRVLLASTAIPGFFPPQEIPVTVDGRRYVEKHVDGGVSSSLFFRPPHVPPEVVAADPAARSLYGTDVYAVVAGKLFADPAAVRPRALKVTAEALSGILYAQGRGDLTRLWTVCELTGMKYHQTSIPLDYPAPKSSTEFEPRAMTAMFEEGVRQVMAGTVWRSTPPGVEPGEQPDERAGTELIVRPIGTPRGGESYRPGQP